MFRKVASLSVALIVTGGLMIAAPAEAAAKISNGVACTKSGATIKTSGGTYRCTTNPLTTSKKITWLSNDCVIAARDAVKAEKSAIVTTANFQEQLPVIELGITTEKATIVEINTKLAAANLRLTGAQTKLAAAKTDADKRILTTAVASWTSATRAYASKIRSTELTIRKLEAAKLAATTKPAELASNVANSRESAKLICTKGF